MSDFADRPTEEPIMTADGPRPRGRGRLLLLAAAGVLVLAVAAVAALLALRAPGGQAVDSVVLEAAEGTRPTTADPSDPSTLAPTEAVLATGGEQGRDVFDPLVQPAADGGDGAATAGADPVAAPLGDPGAAPAGDPVTVTVPGPAVTRVDVVTDVVTETVPGPARTATVTATQTVTSTTGPAQTVTVTSVSSPGTQDSPATFTVNGAPATVAPGGTFGTGLTYTGYDAATGVVTFSVGATQIRTTVGGVVGLP